MSEELDKARAEYAAATAGAEDKSADRIRWRENIDKSIEVNTLMLDVLYKLDRLVGVALAEKGILP